MVDIERTVSHREVLQVIARLLRDICDRDHGTYSLRDGKVVFRQYDRDKRNDNQLNRIDVTIDFGDP